MSSTYQSKRRFADTMPRRKRLRLQSHNYSSPGRYFITICTRKQTEWLATIVENTIRLSPAGEIIQSQWDLLPSRFPGLEIDQFVIMPNHLHGIIVLTEHLRYREPATKIKPTLSDIVDAYKGGATYFIRRTGGIDEFEWHKSFHDLIIRNEQILHRVRRYIAINPERWIADRFYARNV
jgi:putative transposase